MVRSLARTAALIGRARREYAGLADKVGTVGLWLLIGLLLVVGIVYARQYLVNGIIVGSIIALGALGITLIYGILKFAHFAHGDMMMFGAYVALAALVGGGSIGPFSFGWGMIFAMFVSLAVLGAGSIAIDRVVYRPLRQRGSGTVVLAIASLGVAIVLRAVMLLWWGPDQQLYVSGIHPARELPFDIMLKPDQIFIVATAFLSMAAVYLLLFRTKMGKAMRAMSDNADLARVTGIDTEQVVMWTWIIGGALAAVAGILLGIQSNMKPELGFTLLLPLFAGAVLGGLGSPQGALVGAMIVGISQEVFVGIDLPFPPFGVPGYKPAVAFGILILILLVRPRGLFGKT
jgi:branched-chain amino acid transport system permease protein/neutral amino acid transport system permease protein